MSMPSEYSDISKRAKAAAAEKFPAAALTLSLRDRWVVLDNAKCGGDDFDAVNGTGPLYLHSCAIGIVEVTVVAGAITGVALVIPRETLTISNQLALSIERRADDFKMCGLSPGMVTVGWSVALYDPRVPYVWEKERESPVASGTFVHPPTLSDILGLLKWRRLEIYANLEQHRDFEARLAAGEDPDDPPELMPEDFDVDAYVETMAALVPVIRAHFQAKASPDPWYALSPDNPSNYVVINAIQARPNQPP